MNLPTLTSTPSIEQVRAVVEVVVLIAYADGNLAPAEEEIITARVAEISSRTPDAAWVKQTIGEVRPPLPPEADWRSARLVALSELLGSDELRQTAFAVALEVAHVDGGIGLREVSLLAATAQELGLDAQMALHFLDQAEKH